MSNWRCVAIEPRPVPFVAITPKLADHGNFARLCVHICQCLDIAIAMRIEWRCFLNGALHVWHSAEYIIRLHLVLVAMHRRHVFGHRTLRNKANVAWHVSDQQSRVIVE